MTKLQLSVECKSAEAVLKSKPSTYSTATKLVRFLEKKYGAETLAGAQLREREGKRNARK